MKLFAFTIDLESDYAGCINSNEIFNDLEKIEKVLSTLTSLEVKITVFAVGKLFASFPEVIKLFEKYKCEFEAHSYSHDFKNPDSEFEIVKSREAYFNYFGKYPKGYRAPRGNISISGINYLNKYGFSYDSSVIPSFFPNPFRGFISNNQIHFHDGTKIMEIPVTAITPFRILLSVSYMKMLGINFFTKLSSFSNLPDIICFDSHLHDFIFVENSYNNLFPLWKIFYGINKFKGVDFCTKYLKHIKDMGYRFCYMSEAYNLHKEISPVSKPSL